MRIICLVFILLAVPGLAQEQPTEQHPSQPMTEEAANQGENEPTNNEETNLAPSTPNPIVEDPNSRDSAYHCENCMGDPECLSACDLEQQTRMAVGTEDLAYYACIGLVLTVIGLGLLAGTLHYTKQAAKHTAETLKIGQNTLEQNRAWVVYKTRTIATEETRKLPKGCYQEFCTIWKNAGASPAIDVKIEHRLASFEPNEVGGLAPHMKPTGPGDIIGILGPETECRGYIYLTHEAVKLMRLGARRVFIYTIIQYRTVYDKPNDPPHITETVEEVSIINKIVELHLIDHKPIEDVEEGIAINFCGPQQRAT